MIDSRGSWINATATQRLTDIFAVRSAMYGIDA